MTSVPSRPNPVLFSLFGAPGDTGNLGVSALGESTLQSVAVEHPEAKVLRFDNSRGRRRSPPNAAVSHDRDGAWISRRVYRSESLWTMRVSSVVRFPPNRNVEAIRRSAAVLDVSGGDSFTDLYGARRWHLVTLPKLISLRVGTPLVLLPQTYGPFRDPRRRRQAADIVANAQAAWARDPDGLDFLRELLGDRFDPRRHRQGVDVAFALSPRRPDELPDDLVACLDPARDQVTVGLNVSGLLMNEPDGGKSQFGLELDYRQLIDQVSSRLLDEVADHLVLVPHVRGQSAESDDRACRELAQRLDRPGRVSTLPAGLDAGQTKWFVSQLDWFCGTRMHSTIAALSTGVPAAAVAYSAKTRGVFATCGMAHAVVDARAESTGDAADQIIERAHARKEDRAVLASQFDDVVRRARGQFAQILGVDHSSPRGV